MLVANAAGDDTTTAGTEAEDEKSGDGDSLHLYLILVGVGFAAVAAAAWFEKKKKGNAAAVGPEPLQLSSLDGPPPTTMGIGQDEQGSCTPKGPPQRDDHSDSDSDEL